MKRNIVIIALVVACFILICLVYFFKQQDAIDFIKKQPSSDPSLTIGQQLDGYSDFSTKEWISKQDPRGRKIVVFEGLLSTNAIESAKNFGQDYLKEVANLYQKTQNELHSTDTKNLELNDKVQKIKNDTYALFDGTSKAINAIKMLVACSVVIEFAVNVKYDGYSVKTSLH